MTANQKTANKSCLGILENTKFVKHTIIYKLQIMLYNSRINSAHNLKSASHSTCTNDYHLLVIRYINQSELNKI